VIASPPSLFGATSTATEFWPMVTPVIVGASGTVASAKAGAAKEYAPSAMVATPTSVFSKLPGRRPVFARVVRFLVVRIGTTSVLTGLPFSNFRHT
jgi:hypothetical protein